MYIYIYIYIYIIVERLPVEAAGGGVDLHGELALHLPNNMHTTTTTTATTT